MKIFDLINELVNEIEEGRKSLFTTRKTIDVDFVLTVLQEIRNALPRDLANAQKVLDQRDRIIREAKELAQDIIEEAHQRVDEAVINHTITQMAYERSNEIIGDAEQRAYELRMGADDYALSVLDDLTGYISEYASIIDENKSNFLNRKKRDAVQRSGDRNY